MERLDRLIATRRCVSRSDAKKMIRQGSVQVNGATVRTPEYKCAHGDAVLVEGMQLTAGGCICLMMNKPTGVLCATRDREETVLDLVPPELKRKGLFPAGRLDRDTTGFVLLTDDGPFAHSILAPRKHVAKTYHVTLDSEENLEAIAEAFRRGGVDLGEGDIALPARLTRLSDCRVELVIHEGKYHQIKRMFAAFDRRVLALHRHRIGSLTLDPALPPGGCRRISEEEKALLLVSGPREGAEKDPVNF